MIEETSSATGSMKAHGTTIVVMLFSAMTASVDCRNCRRSGAVGFIEAILGSNCARTATWRRAQSSYGRSRPEQPCAIVGQRLARVAAKVGAGSSKSTSCNKIERQHLASRVRLESLEATLWLRPSTLKFLWNQA